VLAGELGSGAPLGGSPWWTALLCLIAGALLAWAMRAADAVRALRPAAPRLQLTTRGTLFVQNTTAARGTFLTGADFGGITTGAGGLTIVAAAPATNVYAFGRRLNADGTFTTGDAYFFQGTYNRNAGAAYSAAAAVNTCIIVTGQCRVRVPPDSGVDGKQPITGPTDGSTAILLPQNEQDDVIDSSFSADPLIEEPVTSGSEPGQWNCDPDHDGDCDDQPEAAGTAPVGATGIGCGAARCPRRRSRVALGGRARQRSTACRTSPGIAGFVR